MCEPETVGPRLLTATKGIAALLFSLQLVLIGLFAGNGGHSLWLFLGVGVGVVGVVAAAVS